jgi:hypothetical protein
LDHPNINTKTKRLMVQEIERELARSAWLSRTTKSSSDDRYATNEISFVVPDSQYDWRLFPFHSLTLDRHLSFLLFCWGGPISESKWKEIRNSSIIEFLFFFSFTGPGHWVL